MYRLLLVDDESDIREGLQEVVDFASYGFEVVGESTNGLEAVQACERLEPDLVVTDIRMPFMDGLTMCRRVQKMLPTTRFKPAAGTFPHQLAIFAGNAAFLAAVRRHWRGGSAANCPTV